MNANGSIVKKTHKVKTMLVLQLVDSALLESVYGLFEPCIFWSRRVDMLTGGYGIPIVVLFIPRITHIFYRINKARG